MQFTAAMLAAVLLCSALLCLHIKKTTIAAYQENSRAVVERYEKFFHGFLEKEMEKLLLYHDLWGNRPLGELVAKLAQSEAYARCYLLDAAGTVIHACDPLALGYDYTGREPYQKALESSGPFSLIMGYTENQPVIDMVVPVYREQSLAYIAVHQMEPAWLAECFSSQHFASEGEVIILNTEGLIFLSMGSPDAASAAAAPAKLPPPPGLFPVPLPAAAGLYTTLADGGYLLTFKPLEGQPLVLANRLSLAIIGEHYRRVLLLMALGAALGLLCFILLKIALSARAMKPAFQQTQQAFRQLAEEYEIVFNGTQDALFLIQVTGRGEFRFLRNNRSHQEKTGITLAEIQGKTPAELLGAELGEKVAKNYRACVEQKKPIFYEETLKLPAGERTWFTTLTPVLRRGVVHHIVGSSQDITQRKEIEKALRLSEERYRLLVENATEAIFVFQDGKTKYINPRGLEILGCTAEAALARPLFAFVHPDDRETIELKLQQGEHKGAPNQFTVRIIAGDGATKWLELSSVAIPWEKHPAILCFANDITERKRSQERLEFLSLHDGLTGLYNRAFFDEEMKRLTGSREYPITIISADLDGLKLINDTLGHFQGDRLIIACAEVLQKSLRSSDILARIGGDEFAVLLPRTDGQTGNLILQRIRSQLEEHNFKNPELPLSVSLGLATAEEGRAPLEETYKKADNLMYKDKLARREITRSLAVDILLSALHQRDDRAMEQAQKVAGLCLGLGEKLKLPAAQLIDLVLLAQVHKLGLIAVPEHIIIKTEALTPEEREAIRQHPEKGHRIALSSPDLAELADLILKQQEWWDGSGHPLGLKGEAIPLPCRILALASTYIALTEDRPYRRALSKGAALEEIKGLAGTRFDPALVQIFLELIY